MSKLILFLMMFCGPSSPASKPPTKLSTDQLKTLCAKVSEIKQIPFRGDSGLDAIYDAFIAAGDSAVPCLIEQVGNPKAMHDPRCPAFFETVAIGDVAYFMIIEITNLGFDDMLPTNVQAKYKTEGALAYHEYIARKGKRRQLQSKLLAWYRRTHGHS